MISLRKFQINCTMVTYFLPSESEDTGHTHLKIQFINYRKNYHQSLQKHKKRKTKKNRKAIAKLFVLHANAKRKAIDKLFQLHKNAIKQLKRFHSDYLP